MNFTIKKKRITNGLFIALSFLLFVVIGCSKDEEELQDQDQDQLIFNSSNTSFATPTVGKIYTIQNLKSGRTLDINAGSNSNGANLQVWGTDVNISSTHRHWEIISVEGNYVRFKGVDSGKSLEVANGDNSNGANVQQWAYQGTTHQQWEIISVGDGYYRIKNRDSGKCLRVGGTTNGSNADQWAYRGWNSQKWFFTEVGSSGSSSTPVDSFISTNDGVFQLNDFQIESSSHRSDSDDISTQSWDADDFSLSSQWYNLTGGDYYLTSASTDGKRTEWKEASGNESSLSVAEVMTYEASIEDIPENGVTIAQMHNRFNESTDYRTRRPLLRVYIENGAIHVKKTNNDLTNSTGTYDTVTVGPSVSEGSKFKVQLTKASGKVNVKVETNSGTLDKDFYPYTEGSYSDYQNYFYFKAGVYTEGNDTEPTIRFYSFEKE